MFNRPSSQFYRVTPAYKRFELDVGPTLSHSYGGQRHRLYGEVSGNPHGPTVICLHGGPGAGSNSATRQFFDPDNYNIVQFDQRGAGRSTPWACMEANATNDLVQDINLIADHLGIKKFALFGGSWGSTLALAYVNAHPERVTAMILRGIFLGRQQDINWFLTGMGAIQPEAYDAFLSHIPPSSRSSASDILSAYLERLMSPAADVANAAATAWASYEDACATLDDNQSRTAAMERFQENRVRKSPSSDPADNGLANSAKSKTMPHTLAIARAEAIYLANDLFLPPQGLLANTTAWQDKPGAIVHGRYDMVCQVQGAIELARHWHGAQLHIVTKAGHSTFESGIAHALLSTMERLKSTLLP